MPSLQALKILLVTFAISFLGGCFLEVTVGQGGHVEGLGVNSCNEASTCNFEIINTNFSGQFEARPNHGYVFSEWKTGEGYLCGGSTNPRCEVSNTQFAGNEQAEAYIASDGTLKLEAIFRPSLEAIADDIVEAVEYYKQIRGLVSVAVDATGKTIGVPYNIRVTDDSDTALLVKVEGSEKAHVVLLDDVNQRLAPFEDTYFTGQACTGDVYIGKCYVSGYDAQKQSVCRLGILGSSFFAVEDDAQLQNVVVQSKINPDTGNCRSYSNHVQEVLPAVHVEFGVTFPVKIQLR